MTLVEDSKSEKGEVTTIKVCSFSLIYQLALIVKPMPSHSRSSYASFSQP